MTTRITSRSDVAHVWAQQTRSHGKAGNVRFDGTDYYSYSTVVARFVAHKGRKAIFITARNYSVSTSAHVGAARGAVRGLGLPVFTVLSLHTWMSDHKTNLEHFKAMIRENIGAADRARVYKQSHLGQAVSWAQQYNAYADFFALRVKRLPTDLDALLSHCQVDIDRMKRAAARTAKAQAKALAARAAEREAHERKQLAEWLDDSTIEYVPEKTYLRVRRQGDSLAGPGEQVIETSRGATFPVSHAAKAWPVIKACREHSREFTPNGHTVHLGYYTVDRIDGNGTVYAGCHVVTYDEAERIAKQLMLI